MQPTLSQATQLRDALASVLPDPTDPRVIVLTAAIRASDPGLLAAALQYVEASTPPELKAAQAIKARLVAEASAMPPRFAVVVDVPALAEGGQLSGDVYAAMQRGIRASHAYALVPDRTAKGEPLACRIVFPSGVSGSLLEHAARALRDLAPALMQCRDSARVAQLSAAVPVTSTPSTKAK